MREIASTIVLLLLTGCCAALPAAVIARARQENHPKRDLPTLVEQAERWTGGGS
ncbi:hypothetical protein [Streptomyces afghaniensis]|uniref:hypothetical protein n=1 Tax=Streptomyces afghaniensis TaxID=66865 RepID=UPI00277F5348|nr:hypothetical protein [Streptomyces afghaniensis]MDQ1018795.1 hypothetical protein [Streptomyces afghaniensis]